MLQVRTVAMLELSVLCLWGNSEHLIGTIDGVCETSDMLSCCGPGVESRSCRIGSGSAARYIETFAKYENRQTCRLQ